MGKVIVNGVEYPTVPTFAAGDHIDITNNVISAEGYISADDPTTATVQPSVTTSMIQDGAVTADKVSEFKVGDSFKFHALNVLPGHITNSSKDCIATVSLPFRASSGSNPAFTITFTSITIRGVNGYIIDSASQDNYNVVLEASPATFSGNYYIRLNITKKDGTAFSNATNNTPTSTIISNCTITRTA